MDIYLTALIYFLIALIISAIIIWVITKLFGEKEGFGTALLAALVGAIIYTLAYFLLGDGLISAILAGIVWTLALGSLYNMGWLKAIVTAVIVWIVAIIVGMFLPTVVGPL
ncbi:MAG: hypothetical protein ACOC55_01480 [Candidatus Natronoplasma sp.]